MPAATGCNSQFEFPAATCAPGQLKQPNLRNTKPFSAQSLADIRSSCPNHSPQHGHDQEGARDTREKEVP